MAREEGRRRSVVVTGASAGVGRAVARAFGRLGWRVGLIARGRERLEAAQAEIEASGGAALVLPADVADFAAVAQAADRAAATWGGIDVWINNAMVTVFAPVAEVTPEEFRRVTEVTYLGQVYGTMAALRHMRPRDAGTIIHVGSALAYRGIPLQAAYCGAKFGIRGFVDALRCELLHEGSRVRLSMVHLPAVNTPQFDWARNRLPRRPQPVPPIFQPEPVADAIVQAAREAPRELWIGCSTAAVIVGDAVAPGLLDRFLAGKGWSGQQSQEPARAGRPDNLFEPVPGDPGARGRFGHRSGRRAGRIDPDALRRALAWTGAGLAAGAATWAWSRTKT